MAQLQRDDYAADPLAQEMVNSARPVAAKPMQDPGGYDYNKFQDAWWHAAPGTNLDSFIANNPSFTKGATTSKGGEVLNLPGGESFDAVRDMGGASAPQWGSQQYDYATGRQLSPQESAAAEAQWAAANPGGGGGGSSLTGSISAGPNSPYSDLISQQIQGLLSRGNKPVTEEDMAAQFAPVGRQFERGATQARAAAAERGAYTGTNLGGAGGALDAESNSINEQLAEKKAGAMGGMMQQELQSRRQDVTNALQFAQGEEKQALELQLAQIDQNLRQQSLGLQSKGMDLQNQQYYDRLGFDIGNQNNSLDAELARSLMSGG